MAVRSPFIKNLLSNISQTNNNLCFYLFVMEEFERVSAEAMRSQPTLFLKQLYSENRYSEALNIKGEGFISQSIVYKNELYKDIYINSYSYLDYYFGSLLSLVRRVLTLEGANTQIKNEKDLSKLEKLITLLNIHTNNIPDFDNLVNTYDYIRYRRNCLMHNAGDSTNTLRNIIKNQGEDLSEYWKLKLLRKKDSDSKDEIEKNFSLHYDFFKKDISKFTNNEMIELFNVFRTLSKLWDNNLITITIKNHKKGFLLYCLEEMNKTLKEENKINIKSKNFESKFKGFTFHLFSYKITNNDLELLYQEINNLGGVAQR